MIFFFTFSNIYQISGYEEEQGIPVLMYHHLDHQLNNNVTITPENFENQIKALKEEGYNSITTKQLYDYLYHGGQLPAKPVLITFDDGYLSNYEEAYPILKKYKTHAEIFVITSRILENDGENPYPNEMPKMNWAQLQEMKDYISIGSHTWDAHYKLDSGNGTQFSAIYGPGIINGKLESREEYEKRVMNDFLQSKKMIKEKLGYEPIAISYPFGSRSQQTEMLAKKAGFQLAFVIGNKRIRKGDHVLSLSRITVNGNDSAEALLNKINNNGF